MTKFNFQEEHNLAYNFTHHYLTKGGHPQLCGQVNIIFTQLKGAVAKVHPFELWIKIDSPHWDGFSYEEKEATIAHEVAHILVYKMFGKAKDHGPEFRNTMLLLGYKVIGADCHSSKHIAARKKLH